MALGFETPLDAIIGGHLTVGTMDLPAASVGNAAIKSDVALERTKMAAELLTEFPIPWTAWRVWNDMGAPLPEPSAADDLGLYGGTWATDGVKIATFDLGGATTTLYARAVVALPPEYTAAGDIRLRFKAATQVVADTTSTLDVECFALDGEGGISADLYAGAALDINFAAFANYDFEITSAGRTKADELDIRIACNFVDAGDADVMQAIIGKASVLCDIKG